MAAFISNLWKEGASASKIKTALSVLETTKKVFFPERSPLLNNGLIRSLIEAAKVDRPVKKKGPSVGKGDAPYYDVASIFSFWSQQAEQLPLYMLRKKVACLLTIDPFLRAADLACFTEEGLSSSTKTVA